MWYLVRQGHDGPWQPMGHGRAMMGPWGPWRSWAMGHGVPGTMAGAGRGEQGERRGRACTGALKTQLESRGGQGHGAMGPWGHGAMRPWGHGLPVRAWAC